jgi:hypothetical protein
MAAQDAPIGTLAAILAQQGFETVSSADVGAGASLGNADLTDVTCAVAVLPEGARDTYSMAPGLTAILVEIGVVVGKGIPTLIITEPDSTPTPALATVPRVAAHLDDRDTLQLHLSVFARTSSLASRRAPHSADLDLPRSGLDAKSERVRLHEILNAPGPPSGIAFEQFVIDLLSQAGGQVESNVWAEDQGIDAVIGIGGPSGTSLVTLVEVKRLSRSSASLRRAADQLLQYLAARRADLGLIVVDQHVSDAAREALPPMILALSADELIDRLAQEPLDQMLRRARNRAVHGV